MSRPRVVLGVALLATTLPAFCAAAGAPGWARPPQLAVMTGYIKDPSTPQTIEEWQKGLGSRFDAAAWVRGFRDAGAAYLIFYDKWIDGLVFHDTQTTSYKTERNFLREVADACHAQKLPLVIYWNAAYDNNPEFAQYATLDQTGNPIRFPDPWPCRLLSMYSPFREKAQQQVREILGQYGPIAGLWLDCYSQPWPTTDACTVKAFEARYHKPPADAPERAGEFVRDTLVEYLGELRRIAAELQPDLAFTYNGSQGAPMGSPDYATRLAAPLGFLSVEGHSLSAMDSQAMAASFLRRPMETGDLVSGSWFSPPTAMAPGRARRAIAEGAAAWCQGANVYYALSPTHEGTFGEDLQAVQAAGQWLRPRQKLLAESTPWHDIGIVLGAPSATLGGFPSLGQLWGVPVRSDPGAWAEAQRLSRLFAEAGRGTEVLYSLDDLAAWPEGLSEFRALVLPERACIDAEHLTRLREYVRDGGTLLVFGHATLLDGDGKPGRDFALADVLGLHYVGPARFAPEVGPATCYSDSDYSPEWTAGNLADNTAAGWASADSPMPHWGQVNLPVEQLVARVRVVGRQGPYLLRDFEVLTWNGAGWDLVHRYEGNTDRIVDCPVEPPCKTLGVRVLVHAETYEARDRRLADIQEIELYGPNGTLLSHSAAYPLAVEFVPGLPAVGPGGDVPTGPAAIAEAADGTEVVATFADPMDRTRRPFLTRHPFGKGHGVWLAVGEASFTTDSSLWRRVPAQYVAGGNRVAWTPSDRHRVILRRVGQALLICAIDTQPDAPPQRLAVYLWPSNLGIKGNVDPFADGKAAERNLTEDGFSLTITPDPAATVLVGQRQ